MDGSADGAETQFSLQPQLSALDVGLMERLRSGGQVHQIEPGVSAEVPGASMGASGHAERLRAERNKLAPMLKALAETGITSSAAATQTRIRQKRIELIAKENGFKFA